MKPVCNLLVVGLKEWEAGKTTVAQALLLGLQDRGVNAAGFKPKAGNTLWYDYNVVYESLKQGRLYGKDSKRLKEASYTDLPEELITPIHRLWATPPHHLKQNLATLPYFIVDRVTLWQEKNLEMAVVNDTLPFSYGRESLVDNLYKADTEVRHVSNVKELNEVIKGYYPRAVELAYNRISSQHEAVVCESYADIALPWKGLKNLDLVLAVQPGYVQAYSPEKYLSAVNLSAKRRREQRTREVLGLLKSIETVKVPPYHSQQVLDKLKKKMSQFLEDISIL